MYKKDNDHSLLSGFAAAAVGAGVATSLAVSRGQSPVLALTLTVIAALCAMICDRLGII